MSSNATGPSRSDGQGGQQEFPYPHAQENAAARADSPVLGPSAFDPRIRHASHVGPQPRFNGEDSPTLGNGSISGLQREEDAADALHQERALGSAPGVLWSDIDRAVAGADWPTIVTRLPGPDGKIFRGSLHDWMSAEGKLPDVFTVLPPGDTATLLSVPSTHESWMETGRWTPVTMNQTDSGEQTAGSDGEFSPRQLFVNFAEEPSSDLRDFLVEHRLAKPAPRSSVGVVLTTGPAPDAGGLK